MLYFSHATGCVGSILHSVYLIVLGLFFTTFFCALKKVSTFIRPVNTDLLREHGICS
jgi:hypothetical protein